MTDKDKLLELIAGLELAIYREQKSLAPLFRYERALEDKLKQTKERLRVILYGMEETTGADSALGEYREHSR